MASFYCGAPETIITERQKNQSDPLVLNIIYSRPARVRRDL